LIINNHQVTVEITLSLPVEKIAKSQNIQSFFHLISEPKLCAQSSIIKISFSLAIFNIFEILEGFQNVC
jgi:hypothetical protein